MYVAQNPMSENPFIEIYAVYDLLEAEQVKGFLEEEGLPVQIRDLGISPYPIHIGTFNEKRILVMESDKQEAIQLISKAIQDQIISSDGQILIKGKA